MPAPLAILALVAAQAPAEGSFKKTEPSALRKVIAVRHLLELDRPGLLQTQPEQWNLPFISPDSGLGYAATDNEELTAIWLASGKTLWRRDDLGRPGRAMGWYRDVLLFGGGTDLIGLEGFSGKERWRVPLGGLVGGEITVAGNLAIVPVRPNGFVAVDLDKAVQVWRVKRPTPETITVRGQAPAAIDARAQRAYLGFSDGTLMGVRLTDGERIWAAELGKARELFPDVDAQPLIRDRGQTVLAASYNGGMVSVDAESGRILWRKDERTALTGLIAVPGARMVVASQGDGQILGISPKSGDIRWRYRLGRGAPSTPRALEGGMVIAASTRGPLAILDAATGRPVQLVPVEGGASAAPAVRGQDVALLGNKGRLMLLRRAASAGTTH